MLDSPLLDVVIGVALTYLLISLLCSTLLEILAGLLKLRAIDLEEGVRSLIGPGTANQPADSVAALTFNAFFTHPLIRGLMRQSKQPDWQKRGLLGKLTGERGPSYIPSRTFAAALFDVIAPEDRDAGSRTLAAIRSKLDRLPDGTLKTQFLALMTPATEANIRSRVNQLPNSGLKTRLLQILDAGTAISDTIEALKKEIEGEQENALRAELDALLSPASLALIRSWLVRLPDDALRRELEAFLGPATAANLREKIEAIGNVDLKHSLQSLLAEAGDDLARAREEVEDWFDQAMARASGWYKRRAQFLLVAISVPVVVGLNADTVTMTTSLWQDQAVRDIAVQRAVSLTQPSPGPGAFIPQPPGVQPTPTPQSADQLRDSLSELTTFGWRKSSDAYKDPREVPKGIEWLWKVFGFAITIGAVSLGADFWFNLVKKLVNIRASGEPKAASQPPSAAGGGPQSGPAA